MSRFTLLLGGDLIVTPRLLSQVANSRVIAADSGIAHATALGLDPELWVGDFDSSDEHLRAVMDRVPRKPYPTEKDLTDGEIAVDYSLAEGADEIIMAGAFGGARADHAFLHMTMALRLAAKGVKVVLTSGNQEGFALPFARIALPFDQGTLFSILQFTDIVVSISGARWPLERREIPFGSSITLSNTVSSSSASVELHSGRALLLANLSH